MSNKKKTQSIDESFINDSFERYSLNLYNFRLKHGVLIKRIFFCCLQKVDQIDEQNWWIIQLMKLINISFLLLLFGYQTDPCGWLTGDAKHLCQKKHTRFNEF